MSKCNLLKASCYFANIQHTIKPRYRSINISPKFSEKFQFVAIYSAHVHCPARNKHCLLKTQCHICGADIPMVRQQEPRILDTTIIHYKKTTSSNIPVIHVLLYIIHVPMLLLCGDFAGPSICGDFFLYIISLS